MRKDMTKVMTRHSGTDARIKLARHKRDKVANYENVPKRESIRSQPRENNIWFMDYRRFDNTKPIENYLERMCGLKWDYVYSNVCKVAPKGSKSGRRLREHVLNLVKVKPLFVGSRVFNPSGSYELNWGFYVDREKILRKVNAVSYKKKYQQHRKQEKATFGSKTLFLNRHECYHWRNGIWWHLKLSDSFPKRIREPQEYEKFTWNRRSTEQSFYDVLYKKYLFAKDGKDIYGEIRRATEKRQLNKREIRQIVRPIFLSMYDKKYWPTVSGR